MSTLWLDVSTVLLWQRPAVGVVRVEAECVEYALSDAAGNYRFCRFDYSGGFTEVAVDEVRAALTRISSNQQNAPAIAAEETPASPPTWKQRYAHRLRLAIDKLPAPLREPALGLARKLRAVFPEPSPAAQQANPAVAEAAPFAEGDVYLSMGADWNHGDLAYLYALKKRYRIGVVLFCYDIIPIKFPHLTLEWVAELFVRYFYNIAWCADEILCISECTRKDLRAFLTEVGTPVPPMSVIKLGCQLPAPPVDSLSPDVTRLLQQEYILYVSTIERRKNHETLYRAYARLADRGEGGLPLLVFVGMPGWGVGDFMADLRLDQRTAGLITVLNHVTDAELGELYKHARFTVYPSLYEGWGLPVAESLAAGRFCLAANCGSIPEVGGDLIEYIDPWDVPGWAERLLWYARNPQAVLAREERIRAEYKPTPWRQTGAQIVSRALSLL